MNDKNEIIVNDNTILKEIKPTFERQQKQHTFISVTLIMKHNFMKELILMCQ